MHCDDETSLLLASLALQAEYGDYQPEVEFISFSRVTFTLVFLCSALLKTKHGSEDLLFRSGEI